MQITELEELDSDEDFGQNIVNQSSYYTVEEEEHSGIANDFAQTVLLSDSVVTGTFWNSARTCYTNFEH